MPKKMAESDRRKQQLLLRVTSRELDIIDSAAHLHRKTAATYVYELVRAHVEALAQDPFVQQDQDNRRSFDSSCSITLEFSGHAKVDGTSPDPAQLQHPTGA